VCVCGLQSGIPYMDCWALLHYTAAAVHSVDQKILRTWLVSPTILTGVPDGVAQLRSCMNALLLWDALVAHKKLNTARIPPSTTTKSSTAISTLNIPSKNLQVDTAVTQGTLIGRKEGVVQEQPHMLHVPAQGSVFWVPPAPWSQYEL
jgi:hypothetical protein